MRDFFCDGTIESDSSSLLGRARLRFDRLTDGDPAIATVAARLRSCGERVDAAGESVGTGEKVNFACRLRAEVRFGGIAADVCEGSV